MNLLKPESKSYGGELRKKRKGRGTRPLSTKETMHLVLRSSQARGDWSFKRKENVLKINVIITKFSKKHFVRIISIANVGNHLHLHIQLTKRVTYRRFIRAITSAIAVAITGGSRWQKIKIKFWDYRPFTRVIRGFRALLTLQDYITINQLEGLGNNRVQARFILASGQNSS
jgi:REP element-mobilizing transposase RayT